MLTWGDWFLSNSQFVSWPLAATRDLGPCWIDIMNTSGLVEIPLEFSDCIRLSMDTFVAFKKNIKIDFYTDCQIFKTISKTKWTVDLQLVQPVVRWIQMPRTFLWLWFFPQWQFCTFLSVFHVRRFLKTKVNPKKLILNMKIVLKNAYFLFSGFVTGNWFQAVLFYGIVK